MLQIQTLIVGQLQTNCYLLSDSESQECVVIDPGDDGSYIAETILAKKLSPICILATHGHFDHILSAFEMQHIFTIPFYIHEKDLFLVSRMKETAEHFLNMAIPDLPPQVSEFLHRKTKISIGTYEITTLETPGHTPGGVSFYCEKEGICFTGDTVFAGGAIGDWRHAYSDKTQLLASVSRILALPEDTTLYPGHGESTSVESEKVSQKRKI
jgi:glyoxylase-like metal-dependent hydrolase (beta-lactamase superfamily II)